MTITDLRSRITGLLSEAGIDTAHRETGWLIEHVTGVGLARQLAFPTLEVDALQTRIVLELADRRSAREPLQYVLGSAEFYGRSFEVSRVVLIPRPETEQLVERVLLRHPGRGRVLDVGTGSGCIAVTLACERTSFEVHGCDISPEALVVARRNAALHGVEVGFSLADALSEAFAAHAGGPFDVVVSNPPYVPAGDASSLAPEVVGHEPHTALFAGDDPVCFHRALARAASSDLLSPGGWLIAEIHDGTGPDAVSTFTDAGLTEVTLHDDLSGRPRVVEGRRP